MNGKKTTLLYSFFLLLHCSVQLCRIFIIKKTSEMTFTDYYTLMTIIYNKIKPTLSSYDRFNTNFENASGGGG